MNIVRRSRARPSHEGGSGKYGGDGRGEELSHGVETPLKGNIGDSIKRTEDDRFIRGRATTWTTSSFPHAPHGHQPQSLAHAASSPSYGGCGRVPGVVAVVTGELLAQHKLAWMPTLSGDTQAVLATDKVRFQGQEVACVIANDHTVAETPRANRGRL